MPRIISSSSESCFSSSEDAPSPPPRAPTPMDLTPSPQSPTPSAFSSSLGPPSPELTKLEIITGKIQRAADPMNISPSASPSSSSSSPTASTASIHYIPLFPTPRHTLEIHPPTLHSLGAKKSDYIRAPQLQPQVTEILSADDDRATTCLVRLGDGTTQTVTFAALVGWKGGSAALERWLMPDGDGEGGWSSEEEWESSASDEPHGVKRPRSEPSASSGTPCPPAQNGTCSPTRTPPPSPAPRYCHACQAPHPAPCPLHLPPHFCPFCNLAHFARASSCPHFGSETQMVAMLSALDLSAEEPGLVEEARRVVEAKREVVRRGKMSVGRG